MPRGAPPAAIVEFLRTPNPAVIATIRSSARACSISSATKTAV